jgi:phosphatidylglycerophosphate synthase
MNPTNSSWRRLAARTHDVITPGNGMTAIGALLTLAGLWALYDQTFWLAFLLIGTGRIFDLLDGHVARLTHTTSLLGEFVDAATDKLMVGVATLVILVQHVVPFFLMVPVFTVQVALVIVAFVARGSHVTLHSSRAGKYSTFILWFSLILYVVALWLLDAGKTGMRNVVYGAAGILMTIAFLGSLAALAGYLRPLLKTLLGRDKG